MQLESAQNLLVEKFYLGPTLDAANLQRRSQWRRRKISTSTVRGRSPIATVRHWVPIGGVLRQATPPTCSDSQPVRLYEDSDDNLLYRCVGTTWMADGR